MIKNLYKEYLKQKSEDLDESSKEDLKKLSLKLDARQNQVDDESILPKVEKEDIPATKLFPKVSGDKDKKYYKVGTNGIIYHDYIFPIKNLNDQELS